MQARPSARCHRRAASTSRREARHRCSGLGAAAGLDEWIYQTSIGSNLSDMSHRVTILDFGGQIEGGSEWGTSAFRPLDGNFVGNAEIAILAEQFIEGYVELAAPYSSRPSAYSTIAIGTNDFQAVSGVSGTAWSSLVERVRTFASAYPGIVVTAASDIEVAWHDDVNDVLAWAANVGTYFDFGDAAGCPLRYLDPVVVPASCQTESTKTTVPHTVTWPVGDRYTLAWGGLNALAFPAIYLDVQALQWQTLSEYGARTAFSPITFSGALVQTARCAQLVPAGQNHPQCALNNDPPEAAAALSIALLSSPYTASDSAVPSTSDIQFLDPPIEPACFFVDGKDVCD